MKRTTTPESLLKNAGFKVTDTRRLVLEIFLATHKPLSIHGVLEKTKRGSVNQATVYRIVEAFIAAGVLRRVDLQHEHAHYELTDEDDHHHIICTSCGKVEDVDGHGDEAFKTDLLRKSKEFATITTHALEFYGICKTCARKA
ncbi:MAG: transcriptional repressor [Candidatus Kerfeldbacteria bacterium]|nr:transcriptional repressor [Candidatus Kerfeldbacteria bacterium]